MGQGPVTLWKMNVYMSILSLFITGRCVFLYYIKFHYSVIHSCHTQILCFTQLALYISPCLLSSFLSWVPEVQRAWKVNKTPLMSHVEHTASTDWEREKGKKNDAMRRFLYPIWPVCCASFIYAVILWSLSSCCCTHSCQIRSISVSPGWSQLKTTPHAMACFSVPIPSISLVCWHRPSSLRAFLLNKCVCN